MGLTVLVADDDDLNREVMEAYLMLEAHTVVFAHNGAAALALAAQVQPHVILLDVRMPDMDGYEVCTELKQQLATRHIPVIIITGFNSPQDRAHALAVGAADFITRPFDGAALLRRIAELAASTPPPVEP